MMPFFFYSCRTFMKNKLLGYSCHYVLHLHFVIVAYTLTYTYPCNVKETKDTAYFNCIAALYKQKEIKLDPHLIQCSNYNFLIH